jgi:acetyl-CoA carboxylase carboxyl transferase subunit alpha
VYMMENTWYTVISPESCSSILWRSWDKKEIAAEQLKLTADHMQSFGLVDDIIPEPPGGAHWDYVESANIVKGHLLKVLSELKLLSPEERINQRIEKFGRMGFWEEVKVPQPSNVEG